jgi:hypothetical protein
MKQCATLVKVIVVPVLLLPLLAPGEPVWEADCGHPYDLSWYGPYDVNDKTIPREKIDIVLRYHFTPWMEDMAIQGSTARQPEVRGDVAHRLGANLNYTLRALPNHPRALTAMGTYQLRLRKESMSKFLELLRREQSKGTLKTAECYFERAIMFSPDDGMVRAAYGVFRHRQGRPDLALDNYMEAIRLMPEDPEPYYNIGLLYVELEEFELARHNARRAYQLGYPSPGLRKALERLGEWQDVGTESEIAAH